jgi:hypothetical protein
MTQVFMARVYGNKIIKKQQRLPLIHFSLFWDKFSLFYLDLVELDLKIIRKIKILSTY